MSEIIAAAQLTGSQFMVAPYYATPQILYFFKEKMVSAVAGSLACLLYTE